MSGGDGDGVTAGSSWNEPISLVDDDNDHTNAAAPTITTIARISCNPLGNRYRSIQDIIHRTIDLETEEEPQVVAGESQAAAAALAVSPSRNDTVDGCMLHPKHPIKIFATDRDMALRRKLLWQPLGEHWSTFHCWTFREILGFDRFSALRMEGQQKTQPKVASGSNFTTTATIGIDWVFLTTYILDVDFLLNEMPELLDVPNVVVIYHYQQDSSVEGASQQREMFWVQEASRRGHSLLLLVKNPRATPKTDENPLNTVMEYGCHHTKMVMIGYSSQRLRVVIHTSNFMQHDLHDKCQGAFVQDFLPKTQDQLDNFETSNFEESLVTYLESYRLGTPLVWNSKEQAQKQPLVAHLQSYDFSTAVGVLIPSIPGYHKTESRIDKSKLYGYLKVQQAIRDHCLKNRNKNDDSNSTENSSNTNIVCQFSSMGSLSKNYLNKISDAWNVHKMVRNSLKNPYRSNKKARLEGTNGKEPLSLLTIVWPTVEEITKSVEGIHGGGSVPGRSKNLHKEFLRPLLHKWGSSSKGKRNEKDLQLDKAKHVPHIKSYYQVSDNSTNNMDWFVLSSHNLSKAAWGEIQNRRVPWGMGETAETLVVQHWELGVFVSPSTLGVDTMGPLSPASFFRRDDDDKRTTIPLPYKIQPDKYNDSDRPWVVEVGIAAALHGI